MARFFICQALKRKYSKYLRFRVASFQSVIQKTYDELPAIHCVPHSYTSKPENRFL